MSRFDEQCTVEARALQICLALIGAVSRRETMTYGELGRILGYERGGAFLAQQLGPLMAWCDQNDLPALTTLVVNKGTGIPGDGLTSVHSRDFAAEQQRGFSYDWYAIFPPTIEELSAARESLHAIA
jgi:hypothetical protein